MSHLKAVTRWLATRFSGILMGRRKELLLDALYCLFALACSLMSVLSALKGKKKTALKPT